MAEETEIAKANIEILDAFFKVFRACLSDNNKQAYHYFSVQTPVDKEYMNIKNLFDGQIFPCYSKQDVQDSIQHIVTSTDMYNSLINNAVHIENANPRDALTPELFNCIGGQNSTILMNTDFIQTDDNNLHIKFITGASNNGTRSIIITPTEDNHYTIAFNRGEQSGEMLLNVKHSELKDKILFVTELNEKAYMQDKANKKMFVENEVPKYDLKKAGIDWKNLSEVNKKALLEGRETSSLTFMTKKNGLKQYTHGHLQLSRIGGNKAQAMFRPAQNTGKKITMKI
jgi:spore coat protein U-like protein